ncbi:Thermospermine synthase ACAULIS5 [Abeliophyllum distichum]|uniref:thermospermine synthase n=1 Tax=Abeliophyllum distichum TaxID=126358 RepID=A0ABD1RFD7_9LAMI
MGELDQVLFHNGFSKVHCEPINQKENNDDQKEESWFEEEIDCDLKWSFALNIVLYRGTSEYQEIALLDTKRFGKVLVIDGKMQSAEVDEFIYHEYLIHPTLLCHPNPKTVFIMGGGEGSVAREALRHESMDKVIIAELEKRDENFDIIVGDLADPVEGGPCYQLYTKSFYENILKSKLNNNGIFVTQVGPAGMFTHKEVFSSIYNTIKQVFKYVLAYTAHVPSFADTWGWVIASDQPLCFEAAKLDKKIAERIDGELLYLNGASFFSSTILNKTITKTLKNETHVYTEVNARFIHGQGVAYRI